MATGNGDERQAAAWERVEAKLDRLGEDMVGVKARLGTVEDRLLAVQQRMELFDRKLDATRQKLEGQIELAKLELLEEMTGIARDRALGATTPFQGQLDAFKGQLDEGR